MWHSDGKQPGSDEELHSCNVIDITDPNHEEKFDRSLDSVKVPVSFVPASEVPKEPSEPSPRAAQTRPSVPVAMRRLLSTTGVRTDRDVNVPPQLGAKPSKA